MKYKVKLVLTKEFELSEADSFNDRFFNLINDYYLPTEAYKFIGDKKVSSDLDHWELTECEIDEA